MSRPEAQHPLARASHRILAWTGLARTLFPILAIYVAVTVTQAIVLRAQTVLNLGIEYRFIALLRSRLYDAVANARWLFVAQSRGTDFSHALTTELDRAGLATYQLLWSASTLVVMAAQVVLALQVSAPLTLLVFAAGGLLIAILTPRLRQAREAGEAITTATSEVHALAIEHLAGMKTVKSQAAERASAAEFSRLANAVAHRALDAVRLQANLRALFEIGRSRDSRGAARRCGAGIRRSRSIAVRAAVPVRPADAARVVGAAGAAPIRHCAAGSCARRGAAGAGGSGP